MADLTMEDVGSSTQNVGSAGGSGSKTLRIGDVGLNRGYMLTTLAASGERGLLIMSGLAFASVASAWYLWASRIQANVRAVRALAWVTLIGSALLLVFCGYILWFADFSWMNQK